MLRYEVFVGEWWEIKSQDLDKIGHGRAYGVDLTIYWETSKNFWDSIQQRGHRQDNRCWQGIRRE